MAASVDELKAWARAHITWFGQSAFRIATSTAGAIFVDPARVPASAGPADLILVTHPHPDHYDRHAIDGLRGPHTVIVMPASCAEPGQQGMSPGETQSFGALKVTGMASYNTTRRFHPMSADWLGYVLEVDGISIYHAGDTDPLPEMSGLHPDIALLPVGGLFTMGWRAAAEASRALGATLAIPMHYNALIGGRKAGRRFADAVGPGSMVLARA